MLHILGSLNGAKEHNFGKSGKYNSKISDKNAVNRRVDSMINSIEAEKKKREDTLNKVKQVKECLLYSDSYKDFERNLDQIFGEDTKNGISSLEKFLTKNDYKKEINISKNWAE
jgi:hypothetical protein